MTEHGSFTTTNHDTIKRWALERGGRPAKAGGKLIIDFAGDNDEGLEFIGWDQWLQEFEEHELAFLYQEQTAEGHPSRFNKLVRRD